MRLPDRLERVDMLRVALAHLHDLTEAALPNDFEQLEGVNGQCLAL